MWRCGRFGAVVVTVVGVLAAAGIELPAAHAQTSVRSAVPLQRLSIASGAVQEAPQPGLPPGVTMTADGQLIVDPSMATSVDGATPAVFDPVAVRLQQLMALNFDRSPAAVLAAWAAELLPPEVESQSTKPAATDATDATGADGGLADAATATDTQAAPATDGTDPATAEAAKLAAETAEKTKAIAEEVAQFGRHVTLGRWPAVAEYLGTLPEDQKNQVYDKLLQSLAAPPTAGRPQQGNLPPIALPSHNMTPGDVLGLADASQVALGETQLGLLGRILAGTNSKGFLLQSLVEQLKSGTRWLGGEETEKREAAALMLLSSQLPDLALEFLPAWPNPEPISVLGLKLLARYFDTKYTQDNQPKLLTQSWEVHQRLLDAADLKAADRQVALRRAVELSTLIEQELGQAWLAESFTTNRERGIRILSQLGGAAATEMPMMISQAARRKSVLALQNTAAEALVKVGGETTEQWQETLTLLASQWLKEAEIAHTYTRDARGGSMMQYDRYGNFFYYDPEDERFGNRNPNQAAPIPVRDLLDIQPSPAWIALIQRELQPRVATMLARLYLKINEEAKAFPQIELVARDQPEVARDLVHEFLRAWTVSHDPNSERRMFNPYMYIYGYNQQAEAIPLSRSRQQRNLAELAAWVSRIRSLPIPALDESLLAQAFTTCHSSAEVFQVEAFVAVFGQIDSLKPETVASLATTMRGNLASVWRQVRVQEAFNTNRKEPQLQAEVLRGYQVALTIVANARQKHATDWRLQLAEATLIFDENAYRQVVQPTTEFVDRRQAAFEKFATAAELYRAVVPELKAAEHSTDVYDYWFYASLGATDLGQVSHENQPVPSQYPLILAAIEGLPGETADQHMGKFANQLFTRMSTVQPQAKYRFLHAGFQIVGDHPRAWEAKKSFEYYNDVTAEIKLVAEIDGSDVVGHQQPFGVVLKLVHTNEMERESGGFQKYVQNQTQSPYAYNYGRPNEDYRNKFQEAATKALSENFEVISVTFEEPKSMKSRPSVREGWRETPYAYVLLKARGPQIDRLPPLQLNLDFMDSAGFVVLPIESPALVVDASPSKTAPRPYSDLELVQTIDERQAADGKLILEIQAKAKGLVPNLEQILDLKFDQLEVTRLDDQQASPTGFDGEADGIQITSDRSWLVELQAKPGARLEEFAFSQPKDAEVSVRCQQYQDADLIEAQPIVRLGAVYQRTNWTQMLLLGVLGLGVVAIAVGGWVFSARRPAVVTIREIEMPTEINPFTVLGVLQKVRGTGKLTEKQQEDLDRDILLIQTNYFGRSGTSGGLDLLQIASKWVR